MTFAKHASSRRSRPQIRPLHRAEPHPIQDLRRGHSPAPVPSVPQHDARVQPALPTWSSLTIKAAEILAGFAAGAEAMHASPVAKGPVPAETDDTDPPRGAKPSLSLMTLQANDGSSGHGNQARPGARATALPAERPDGRQGARTDWCVSLTHVADACWSSLQRAQDRRRAIEELRSLDDRSLRDIGLFGCDIEYIVRYGGRRE